LVVGGRSYAVYKIFLKNGNFAEFVKLSDIRTTYSAVGRTNSIWYNPEETVRMILNSGTIVVTNSERLPSELEAMLERVVTGYQKDTGAIDYERFRFSEDYVLFTEQVKLLQTFNPATIKTIPSKKSFWINVYNALALHGIIHFHIKLTVWERPNFFFAAEYNVGGYRFSLDDIKHGILRGNKKRWKFFPPPFRGNDPRKSFILRDNDARIHFALYYGARSNPPIRVYSAEKIHDQLDTATEVFVNGAQFHFDMSMRVVHCSKLLRNYRNDFGDSKAERLQFIAQYVHDEDVKKLLLEDPFSMKIRYMPFDWHLHE
jgi:hypothetical protein